MNTEELNALAKRVHKIHEKWWQDPATGRPVERNKGELLMLVITELAEACEGERKSLMDDKLPHRCMAEVEMADTAIRLLDFAKGFSYYLHEFPLRYAMPTNKGEALLQISKYVCEIPFDTSDWCISQSLQCIEVYCRIHGYDLWGALEEKLAYNATREDHKFEARLQAGGKKW